MIVAYERYTVNARRILALAQEEARMFDHQHIGTEHLLLGMVREESVVAGVLREQFGLNLDALRWSVEQALGLGDTVSPANILLSKHALCVLNKAFDEAVESYAQTIQPSHLLLSLVRHAHDATVAYILEDDTGWQARMAARSSLVRSLSHS